MALVGAMVLYTSMVRITRNFHEVDPGRFYRSAQLSPSELEDVVNKYGIRTVINLRGKQEDDSWYNSQIAAIKKLGIKEIDIGFSSKEVPGRQALINYLEALNTAERPILVHCRSGADRTGEATVIYAIEHMKMPKDQAVAQFLNFRFYHFELLNPAKKFFIKRYAGLAWAKSAYDPCSKEYEPYFDHHYCPQR